MMATFEELSKNSKQNEKDDEQNKTSSDESDWLKRTNLSSFSDESDTHSSSSESTESLFESTNENVCPTEELDAKQIKPDDKSLELAKLSIQDESTTMNTETKLNETAANQTSTSEATLSSTIPKHLAVDKFDQLNLVDELLKGIKSVGIEQPNDLQRVMLPELLTDLKNDQYFKTKLHSGKKTAFLISALQRIDVDLAKSQVLIVTPSYELVHYLVEQAKNLSKYQNIKVSSLQTIDSKVENVINDHLIVSTPFALLSHLKNRLINIDNLNYVIFDEIEVLTLTDSKISNLNRVFNQLIGVHCQFAFFSTTSSFNSLKYVKKSRFFRSKELDIFKLSPNLMDNFFQFHTFSTSLTMKHQSLVAVLRNTICNHIVVYATHGQAKLKRFLDEFGFRVNVINKTRKTEERLDAIKSFNECTEQTIIIFDYPILHGLPIKDVSMVINFDLPENDEHLPIYYEHRIGVCDTTNSKPAFVVNLVDKKTVAQFKRLNSYFKIKMIQLDLNDH